MISVVGNGNDNGNCDGNCDNNNSGSGNGNDNYLSTGKLLAEWSAAVVCELDLRCAMVQ